MSGDVLGDGAHPEIEKARKLQKPFRISDVLNILMDVFVHIPAASKR